MTDIWPKNDNGEPVTPSFLMTVTGTQMDYELAISLLRSFAIPTLRDFPDTAGLAKIILGFAGTGMDVYVPENMLEFAREVIKPVDGDALEGIDFEDADAGEDE
ncbi:MAG: hypothetical protein IKR51_02450 [Oscillospiraceae bacterium]|nr:hypothetical protein [Oscillospiraceae bacterium]